MNVASHLRTVRRTLAGLLIAALAMVGIAGPAMAADINPGLIDPSKTATLNVNKFEQPVKQGRPGDGTVQDTSGLTPMAGINFKVERISDIDLTTNEGWQKVAELNGDVNATNGMAKDQSVTKTTGATGQAKFDNLPLGLYLVTEELTPEQLASGITGIKPFLVTLPITDPNNRNAWLYEVNVYPKNNVDSIEKQVDDSKATKIGDEIKFTIFGDIPAGAQTKRYTITDKLDTRLTHTGTVVSVDGSDVQLIEGTDYVKSLDAATNTVTVDFLPAGFKKLYDIKQATPAARVKVVVSTTVNAVGDGEIKNQATLFPNDSNTTGIPSDEVVTKWGSLDLLKVDATNADKKLSGAKFKVYPTEADAKAGTNAIVIGSQDTWTTDSNGRLSIEGLRLSKWENNQPVGSADYQNYWIVETEAPNGYSLLGEPIEVTVNDNDKTTVDITVKNTEKNGGFELPFTGGAGTLYFFLIGGGLILVAAGFYMYNRSKKKANA